MILFQGRLTKRRIVKHITVENTESIEIHVGLKDNESSNLFLRSLFSRLTASVYKFMATASKDSKNKIITLGILTTSNTHSIGVSCRYKERGCIEYLIFDDVYPDLSSYLKSCVQEALENYKAGLRSMKLAYSFESSTHFIKPIELEMFNISLNDDYSNSISFNCNGYDIEDGFNFNKYKLESILDCFSIYYDIPFDTRHIFSDRFRSIVPLEVLMSTDPNFVHYKEIELDSFIIKVIEVILTIDKKEFDCSNIFKMTRLYRDGVRLEHYGFNGLSINFKEISHSIYMSCLEVISENKEKNEQCIECGQEKFKISKRISDLIYEMSGSEQLQKLIKKEYGKRSKFLHAGAYFSSNSLITDKYIPQLSTRSDHGHILQVNHHQSLFSLKQLLKAVFINEFDYLKEKNSN
jgi:hypothetical protein